MRKILYSMVMVLIISTSIILWHRSYFYAIGFFMPVDRGPNTAYVTLFRGLREAWLLGLEDTKVLKKFEETLVEIPADIETSLPILRQQINQFLKSHNRWWWSDKKLLIVAGFSSGQLKAGQETVRACGRSVVCVSPASSTPQAASWPNVLQMVHNDNFAAQAATMFIRRKRYDKAVILHIPNDPYSQGYSDALSQALNSQDIEFKALGFQADSIEKLVQNEVNPYLSDAKKPVFIFTGWSKELIQAERVLDKKASILCSSSCDNLGDIFAPTREIAVIVPAIMDYTTTTRSVYQRIFDQMAKITPSFNYVLSYGVPFAYDFACQIGNMINNNLTMTWHNFANHLNAALANAALVSTWYTAERNGPAHGGYWFIYTHDPKTKDLVAYRKAILGNTNTLPESAAVAYQIGYYAWAGLLGWNMYQNIWEDYYINGSFLTTKLSYDNREIASGIVNWSPFHVKKYKDKNGKWWFASDLVDNYPLEEKKYELV